MHIWFCTFVHFLHIFAYLSLLCTYIRYIAFSYLLICSYSCIFGTAYCCIFRAFICIFNSAHNGMFTLMHIQAYKEYVCTQNADLFIF